MKYKPKPFDTKGITLTPELIELQEQLAKNAHDIWAEQRMKEGWVYGNKRDDDKKTHPCLVPYEQLKEEEKQYDRLMAMETLRLIIAMGYRVSKY